MAKVHCFSALLVGKKKKSKGSPKAVEDVKAYRNRTLQVKLETLVHPSGEKDMKETSFTVLLPFATQGKDSTCSVKVLGDDRMDETEGAYEGGDEHDDILSLKRDFSDFDLQAKAAGQGDGASEDVGVNGRTPDEKCEKYDGVATEAVIQSGHVSDPGIGQKTAFWGSPRLKRSCSNIETRVAIRLPVSPSKSLSYDDLQNLPKNVMRGEVSHEMHGSPLSVMTPCSADRVMLKKRSSSQVLPSRSRRLWWKLFMWSHRNLHKPWTSTQQRKPASFKGLSNPKGGYSSDTLEPSHALDRRNKKGKEVAIDGSRTDLWPQNQWVAFSAESSSQDRVDAWVNSLEVNPQCLSDYDEDYDGQGTQSLALPPSPEVGESSGKNNQQHASRRLAEDVLQANHLIRSLNSLSSVAHISGMGLKVIPSISAFLSLRAVNLSNNAIVHITPGALPKGLHVLDLSRNKIAAVEGFRELTRLRVLNLSYNRISRIGHGLSNCTLIKELYLAGNKISNVEGLHRLLKLSVLDLSFNKITTAKALGQLVANYNSLLALNLLGNPIQSNLGDDHLRKAVSGLLPHLTYLNKQPVKPQRAREAATDNIAKAALGNGGWSSRRRSARRASQGSSSCVRGRVGGTGCHRGQVGGVVGNQSSRHRSKSKHSPSVRRQNNK